MYHHHYRYNENIQFYFYEESVILFYFTSDFKSEADSNMLNQISLIQDPNQRAIFDGPAHALVNGLQKDRQTLIETDLTRAIIYSGCLFLF